MPDRVVWARGPVVLTSCPTAYVSPESWRLLEQFYAWKLLGGVLIEALPARSADAFYLLERELARERNHAE